MNYSNTDFNAKDFDFDVFTRKVNRGEIQMGIANIQNTIEYIKVNKSKDTYQLLMRVLWSIVMYDPRHIKDIPSYYFDEDLVRESYRANYLTYAYMGLFNRNVYLREGNVWDAIRSFVKRLKGVRK